MKTKLGTIWKAYAPVLRRYRWQIAWMNFWMVMTVITKCLMPLWLADIVVAIHADDATSHAIVWRSLGWIALTLLAHNVSWFAFDMAIVRFEVDCMRDIDLLSFGNVQRQSARFFENSLAGSLGTSAKRIRHTMEFVTDAWVYSLGRSVVMLAIATIVFWMKDPWYGAGFALWAVSYSAVSWHLAKYRMGRDAVAAKAESAVGGALVDAFSCNQAIRSFAQEEAEFRRFREIGDDCHHKRFWAWQIGGWIARVQGLFIGIMEFGIIAALVYGWTTKAISIGDFIFFQTYAILMVYQTFDIGNVLNKVFKHLADAEEMAEIYDTEPEVRDAPGARPLIVEEGTVCFHAVDFRYEPTLKHAVKNFSLRVKAGESVAIVGKSGAGKSTLVKLLLRYYDVDSGYISIDNQYLTNVTQISLRQHIALVPQQPDLFHRTIRENVAFARPDATEKEITDALERAHAWEFIRKFPKGIETEVGERGVKLSGGEKQRIALARAFLADRPILILDEATSALDSETEAHIQAGIAELLRGKTSLVIAHRLSTIMRADRIVVMEKGSIVEEGSHDELLRKKGTYHALWARQSGGYLPI